MVIAIRLFDRQTQLYQAAINIYRRMILQLFQVGYRIL